MANPRVLRRKLRIMLIVLLALDVAAAAVLLSPVGRSSESRKNEMDRLWTQLQLKTRQAEPLRGMDQKVAVARQEIAAFYQDRLPARYSAIGEELGKLAAANNTRITQARYQEKPEVAGGLRPVFIEANLSGNYLQLMKFINAVERDKLFFVVDSIGLGEAQGGVVRLQVRLETYLKSGAA